MKREVILKEYPRRIISLVPSQSELLWDLGLRDELIGITKFCVHPKEMFKSKTRVGGTKVFNMEKIKSLKPDLIIGNKEENEQLQIEELMQQYPVWMSDIFNLQDAMEMISSIGELVNQRERSNELKEKVNKGFNSFAEENKNIKSRRTAYLIWKNPYMVAGHATFLNEMMKLCGFINAFEDGEVSRYPEITRKQLIEANPELILLSSEPYPFKEKHVEEFKSILPDAKVLLVDGEMFSWYGSRLMGATDYFRTLLKKIN